MSHPGESGGTIPPGELHRCRPALADAIERYFRESHGSGRSEDAPPWEQLPSRTGAATLRVAGRYLHSSISPGREAERLAEQTLLQKPDAIVVFGTGLGYHLEELRRRDPALPLFLVEPFPVLLRHALETLPLRWWCEFGPDSLFAPEETASLTAALNSCGANNPALLALQGVALHDESGEKEVRAALEQYRQRRRVNRNTLRRFGKLWVRNTLRNLPRTVSLADISSLPKAPQGVPALVCGAGPTLDSILPRLPDLAQRCIVIAVDTAVARLQGAGIMPHLAIVADPQYWNTRHLDQLREPWPLLVAESATHPRVFRLWRGEALLFASLFPLGTFFDRRAGRQMKLGAGGSVATSAWDLARVLGCGRIYLAGVDMGFPENRTHCAGSFFEERIILRADRLHPAEGALFRYLHDARPEPVPAAGGGTVLSDRRMSVYRAWFSEQQHLHGDTETFQLSPCSARIEGVETADPEELVQSLPVMDWSLPALPLPSARPSPPGHPFASGATLPVRSAREEQEALRERIEEIAVIAREGLAACSSLRESVEITPADLRRLDEIDQTLAVHADRELAGFLAEEALEQVSAMTVSTPRDAVDQADALYHALQESCRYHQDLLLRLSGKQGSQ